MVLLLSGKENMVDFGDSCHSFNSGTHRLVARLSGAMKTIPPLVMRYSARDWMVGWDGIGIGIQSVMYFLQDIIGGFAGNMGECWMREGER